MGEALFELEQTLRSSKYKITEEEQAILNDCKGKAVRDFTITASVASGLVWTALRRLSYGYRVNLAGGAALASGMWRFDRSLNSCADNILAMEGSRMQNELAKILLTKHRHNPKTVQLLKKHFYPEKVYDDTSADQPFSRWRFRNFFTDGVLPAQRSHDNDTNEDDSYLEMKQLPESGQFTMRPAFEMSTDPLDCVFGYSAPPVDVRYPDASTDIASKRRTRSNKRAQRRHRARHREASSDTSA